jgi:hypothetical protein
LPSVILSSHSMWSNNVPIQFISSNTIPVSHYVSQIKLSSAS